MSKRTIRFIVNPFSGVSKKQNLQGLLRNHLDHSKYTYDLFFTERAGHAKELAQKAVDDKIDIVVAVGGDGTVNEVAQPLVNTNTVLGILPGGSGNGFAKHLGIGRNIMKAIHILNKGKVITVDTCQVNGEPYFNVAGVGFDAFVAFKSKYAKLRGFFIYLWNALRFTLLYKNKNYTVQWNNIRIQEKFLSIVVANATYFGYNFAIAPMANFQDGLLDTVFIKNAWKIRYILSLWRFFTGSIHKSRIAQTERIKQITISSDSPMYYHVDGEGRISDGPLTFRIIPRSLMVWVPTIAIS